MAENGDVRFGVHVETSGEERIQKLRDGVAGINADLTRTVKLLGANIASLTKDLDDMIRKTQQAAAAGLKLPHGSLEGLVRRRHSAALGAMRNEAAGIGTSAEIPRASIAQVDAAVRAEIQKINNTIAQSTARVAEAHLNAYKREMRASEIGIEMSAAEAARKHVRDIRRYGDPGYQAGVTTRDLEQERRLTRTGQVGSNQAAMENTIGRLGSDGGSLMMGIQARVLSGYVALSSAFNVIKAGGGFVAGLDKEFRQFQAITRTTNTEMETLEKRLISVSEKTKFTALEVAQAATVMGQAGFSARQVSEAIEPVTLLATAAGTTLASAVDLVTSTLSIFNLQASQTVDVANTMTAAINGSKLTIEKLALGFQYAGNIAAQSNITYTELTATLGALANSGIRSGSTLGTGLRQLLVDLQTPTEKFTKRLRDLNLTQQDVDVSSRGLVPVLTSLMEAGFGAADAFESFEVRAAASFSALTNNIDLIGELRKQFVLSNAAAEANAVQMEALSNTMDKFRSVMGTTAYTAFKPFVAFLQDVIDKIADFMAEINRVPYLLETIAVLLAGLGSAMIVQIIGALFRGLAYGLPILSGLATTAKGVAVGLGFMTAATTATTAATVASTGAFKAFTMALLANPITAVVTALTMAGAAFYAFRKGARDSVDSTKAVIDTLEGSISKSKDEIEAIDQSIRNLIARKAELEKNPVMREATILEVVQQFKSLGIEIDASKTSVDQLISALNNLKQLDFSSNIVQMTEKLIELEQLRISLANENKKAAGADNVARINESLSPLVDDATRHKIESLAGGPRAQSRRLVKAAFGGGDLADSIDPLIELLHAGETPAGTALKLNANLSIVKQAISTLESEKSQLSAAGKDITEINNRLTFLGRLFATASPMVGRAIEIDQSASESRITSKALQTEKINEALLTRGVQAQFQSLAARQTGALSNLNDQLGTDRVSTRRAAELSGQLLSSFEREEEKLRTSAEKWFEQIAADIGVSVDTVRKEADRMAGTVGIPELKNKVRRLAQDRMESAAKVDEASRKSYEKFIDTQISTEMRKLSNTGSVESLKSIEAFVKKQMEAKRELTKKIYEDKLLTAGTQEEREINIGQRTSALDTLDQEEEKLLDQIEERHVKIIEDSYKVTLNLVKDEIKVIEEGMDLLLDEIKKATPGGMMDSLVAKYRTMMESLGSALDTQSVLESGVTGFGGLTSPDDILINKIIGKESGGKPGAKNNLSTATGLGQFIESTWIDIMTRHRPDIANMLDEKALLSLRTDPNLSRQATGYLLSDNRLGLARQGLPTTDASLYLAHFLGLQGASSVLQANPNTPIEQLLKKRDITSNPTVLGGGKTAADVIAWAARSMGAAPTGETTRDRSQQLDQIIEAAELKEIQRSSAAGVRSSKATIAGTMTQAGRSNAPARVRVMIDAVNAEFDEIMEAEIRKFQAENRRGLQENDPETLEQLSDLRERIGAERTAKLSALIGSFDKAMQKSVEEPLEVARRKLEEAQRPGNAGKFTAAEIRRLQGMVYSQEQAVIASAVAAAEEKLVLIREQLADVSREYGDNSAAALQLKELEIQAEKDLAEAVRERKISQEAAGRGGLTMGGAFDNASDSFKLGSGLFKADPKSGMLEMLTVAEQMESVFGRTFDTLASGLTDFFGKIASGTDSIKDSMRHLGLTIVQTFMEMISRALAYQVVLSLIKRTQDTMGGGGGSGLFRLLGSMLTVPGAANGELIRTGIPNRDSTLRLVEPGEMILRKSAVDIIGQDKLVNINNMGNRRMSQSAPDALMDSGSGGGVVNVYVVSPDAVPPLGPNDIVATVSNNLERKGPLRQLIKQISLGAA